MDSNNILIKIGADITQFSRAMKQSTTELDKFKNANRETFDAYKKVGAAVTAGGVAIAAGIGLAVKEAASYQSAFAGVRKTTDATEAEFATLSKGIRDMAKVLPTGADEIANVTAAASQLGIKKEALMGFTRTMVDLGVATNMSAEDAATALARFANITNMSQNDFNRLGSTVVDLGNKFATTEGEIVEMALRLAGAGAQVGMSEADIMGLSAALSSVGIQAEMGGSAISKALVNMQVATSTGFGKFNEISNKTGLSLRELQLSASNTPKHFTQVAESLGMTKTELMGVMKSASNLENFAKIAGMTGEEFKKAFETDAVGALGAFINGLGGAESAGTSAIEMLDEMGISEVRLRDSLLRAGNASELFAGAIKTANGAWSENVALTNEAEERYKTFESKLAMFKNVIRDVAISIGDALLPMFTAIIDKISGLVSWFGNLNPKIIQAVAVFAAIAGAVMLVVGPILLIIGFIPAIISGFGAIATTLGIAGGAAGLFSAALAVLTGPVGLIIAALALLTIGTIALVNHLKKDVIPEVDRFGESVSESTKKALGGFFELSDGASAALADMSMRGIKVTDEMAQSMISKYADMNKQIVDGLNKHYEERRASMESFFLNSSVLTDTEEAAILQKQENAHNLQILSQESKHKRIAEIMNQAAKEKRELTQSEADEIANINDSMNKNAVKALSKNEVEQKIILERMAQTAGDVSLRQARDVVTNSAKQRDGAVKEAEKQYDETLANIIRMRDETGEISTDQATKLIAEAKRQRDESVKHAESLHKDVVKEAEKQSGDLSKVMNTMTGEQYGKWDAYIAGVKERFGRFKADTKATWDSITSTISNAWKLASATTSAVLNTIGSTLSRKFGEFVASAATKMGEVRTKISEKWAEVMTFFNGIDLKQTGKDIVGGLVKGIGDMFGKVKTKIEELADSIPAWARKILGIHSPSRVMAEIGKFIGQGLGNGISDSKRAVIGTMTGLLGVLKSVTTAGSAEIVAINRKQAAEESAIATKKARDIANIHAVAKSKKRSLTVSEAQRIAKIETDSAAKLVAIQRKHGADKAKAQADSAKEYLDAVKTFVSDKKSLEQLSLVAESEVWRRSVDLFAKGTKERVEAQKAYQSSLKTINDEITKTNEEYAGKMQATNDKLRDEERKLTDAYEKSVDDRTKALTNFMGIFDAYEYKFEQTGEDLTKNLRSQIFALEGWQHAIEQLSAKAIDKGLLAELREMGPKALPQLVALNSMTDTQLTEYSELYRKKAETARKQAEAELVGMKADTQKRITELRTTANLELEALRKDWLAKIKGITSTTNTELLSLKTIGKNAGQGLLNGLASMEDSLVAKARSIANAVSAAMAKALQVKSPSRVMMRIGRFVGEGLEVGMDNSVGSVMRAARTLAYAAVPDVPKVAGYQTPVSGAGVGRSVKTSDNAQDAASAGINVTLHYAGSGGMGDAMEMVDIVERELGSRLSSRQRWNGVKA